MATAFAIIMADFVGFDFTTITKEYTLSITCSSNSKYFVHDAQ